MYQSSLVAFIINTTITYGYTTEGMWVNLLFAEIFIALHDYCFQCSHDIRFVIEKKALNQSYGDSI